MMALPQSLTAFCQALRDILICRSWCALAAGGDSEMV